MLQTRREDGIAASEEALEHHRSALLGHCYRMLGSISDAEDAVQESLIRAWRHQDRFEGRATLRNWLYRIATNVCLDVLNQRSKRAQPVTDGPLGSTEDVLVEKPRSHWLEPIHDPRALPVAAPPDTSAIMRQSIRMAFVAALQYLPPRQRAALLLKEVLGWSTQEIAASLEQSDAATNSMLQRARTTMASKGIEPDELLQASSLTSTQETLLEQYVDAFHRYDIDALTALLHQDATLSMPPYSLWLQGARDIGTWMRGRGIGCKGSRLVPTLASGQPAFAQYRPGPPNEAHRAWSLILLDISDRHITSMTHFLDTERLFPHFELSITLA